MLLKKTSTYLRGIAPEVQEISCNRGGSSQIHRKPHLGEGVKNLRVGSLLGLLQLSVRGIGIGRTKL